MQLPVICSCAASPREWSLKSTKMGMRYLFSLADVSTSKAAQGLLCPRRSRVSLERHYHSPSLQLCAALVEASTAHICGLTCRTGPAARRRRATMTGREASCPASAGGPLRTAALVRPSNLCPTQREPLKREPPLPVLFLLVCSCAWSGACLSSKHGLRWAVN